MWLTWDECNKIHGLDGWMAFRSGLIDPLESLLLESPEFLNSLRFEAEIRRGLEASSLGQESALDLDARGTFLNIWASHSKVCTCLTLDMTGFEKSQHHRTDSTMRRVGGERLKRRRRTPKQDKSRAAAVPRTWTKNVHVCTYTYIVHHE